MKKKTIKARNREKRLLFARRRRRTLLLICLAVFTSLCGAVFTFRVIRHESQIRASRQELAALPVLPRTPDLVWSTLDFYDREMRAVNPDYVGLLRIEGTSISYPVVRGADNVKYLTTSFGGDDNAFGGLFMDYRCVGENIPHIIIYGHHAGDMYGNRHFFGGLDLFLDDDYRAEHSAVIIIENDYIFEYEIFSARVTDIYDPAYWLNFDEPGSFDAFLDRNSAPEGTSQILTLSTCHETGEDDRRIVVQGALRSANPVTETQMMISMYR